MLAFIKNFMFFNPYSNYIVYFFRSYFDRFNITERSFCSNVVGFSVTSGSFVKTRSLRPPRILETNDISFNTLDMECYKCSAGVHIPYAIGFTTTKRFTCKNIKVETVSDGLYYKHSLKPADLDYSDWLGNILKKEFLVSTVKNNVWFVHNGGRYDFVIILKVLLRLGYTGCDIDL